MRLINLGRKMRIKFAMILLLLLILNTEQSKSKSTIGELFIISDDAGPVFDLTLLPDFADLIPGSEPVIVSLDLRVGVSDPDNVDTVIGSYCNNTVDTSYCNNSENWTNVTLDYDDSTSNSDDYAAHALNYTIPGGTSLTIWNIRFFANDSLGNWNVSRLKTMSVSRQQFWTGTGTETTPTNGNLVVGLLIGVIIMIPIVIAYAWYIKSKRSKY